MNKMILANLVYRPVRSVISVLAVAIEVTMILLMVGLMLGILDDSKDRQRGLGADVIVRPLVLRILGLSAARPPHCATPMC